MPVSLRVSPSSFGLLFEVRSSFSSTLAMTTLCHLGLVTKGLLPSPTWWLRLVQLHSLEQK